MVWTSRKSMIFHPLLVPVSASEQRFIINHFFSVGLHTFLEENSKNVFSSTLDLSLNPSFARHCVCLCLLTLMSEGGGGRGGGNRGSRCRDGTLADGLLHDTPPLHLVHHKFYRDKGQEDEGWGREGGKDMGPRGECGGDGGGGKAFQRHFTGSI